METEFFRSLSLSLFYISIIIILLTTLYFTPTIFLPPLPPTRTSSLLSHPPPSFPLPLLSTLLPCTHSLLPLSTFYILSNYSNYWCISCHSLSQLSHSQHHMSLLVWFQCSWLLHLTHTSERSKCKGHQWNDFTFNKSISGGYWYNNADSAILLLSSSSVWLGGGWQSGSHSHTTIIIMWHHNISDFK